MLDTHDQSTFYRGVDSSGHVILTPEFERSIQRLYSRLGGSSNRGIAMDSVSVKPKSDPRRSVLGQSVFGRSGTLDNKPIPVELGQEETHTGSLENHLALESAVFKSGDRTAIESWRRLYQHLMDERSTTRRRASVPQGERARAFDEEERNEQLNQMYAQIREHRKHDKWGGLTL